MRKKNRLLAIFMTFILLFSSLNFAVSAESAPAAAAPTRVTEVEVMRQTNSETYIMSDGSYECVVYAYDKYYEDADKSLQLVDNRIVPAKTEMRSGKITADKAQYKNAANAFDVHFSASGTPEVSIAYQNASVTFSPVALSESREAATFSVGKVTAYRALSELAYTGDNTVTYTNAFPNTDLVYVLENNSLKEYIILNNTNAANTFRFSFTLDGVTLRSMDKYAEFVDENGATLFALDSLFAVDSAGVFTDALTYSFTPVTGTNKLTVTVTLDNAYLSDPDRVFPVIIDPTVMISSSETADACVCSYTPNTNYQGATQLRTGMDTDYGIRRSYIKFNIPSSIPAGSVTAARIEIEKLSGVNPTIKAYRCTSTWSSATITWNNKPGYTTTGASSLSTIYSAGSTWHKMDVTTIVQSWVNATYANYGFVLKDNTESNTSHWTTLYSSDAPSPHKPELYITYTTVVPEPEPEPDPGPTPLRSIRLYGVTNTGHDHDSALEYVSTLMDCHGLTYNEVLTGAFYPETFKAQLGTTRIITTRSHGYTYRQNDAVIATGLQLNDIDPLLHETIEDAYLIANKYCPIATVCERFTYISDSDDFTDLDLALFIGCETSLTGTDGSNFTKRVYEQGAQVTVGFTESIDCDEANEWTELFYEYFLEEGFSVADAAFYATNDISPTTKLWSYTIYGDGDYVMS